MWLFTNFGFFSVVQKPGEKRLTIRSRVRADLAQLRRRYLPTMGKIVEHGGGDYQYRATASHAAFGEAVAKVVADIHYANFKSEVAGKQGRARHDVYTSVWNAVWQLNDTPATKSTTMPAKPSAKDQKGVGRESSN